MKRALHEDHLEVILPGQIQDVQALKYCIACFRCVHQKSGPQVIRYCHELALGVNSNDSGALEGHSESIVAKTRTYLENSGTRANQRADDA